MKVNIEFESTDAQGDVLRSNVFAVMEVRRLDYRLVYVEDLSGDGKMTRSTIHISEGGLRITRKGELNTDFMYGKSLVHHTTYHTPYGMIPVTIETDAYDFNIGRTDGLPLDDMKAYTDTLWDGPGLPDDFEICAETSYRLIMGEQEALPMKIRMRITSAEQEIHRE